MGQASPLFFAGKIPNATYQKLRKFVILSEAKNLEILRLAQNDNISHYQGKNGDLIYFASNFAGSTRFQFDFNALTDLLSGIAQDARAPGRYLTSISNS